MSENARFAFLLRNIFEREWKCFALVCRAQTKDTHTHTHCSVYTLLQRQFFSVFTLPRATRTHARAQAGSRADSVSHTAFGDSRPRCSLSEVEPPADNARARRLRRTRARTDRLILGGRKSERSFQNCSGSETWTCSVTQAHPDSARMGCAEMYIAQKHGHTAGVYCFSFAGGCGVTRSQVQICVGVFKEN